MGWSDFLGKPEGPMADASSSVPDSWDFSEGWPRVFPLAIYFLSPFSCCILQGTQ